MDANYKPVPVSKAVEIAEQCDKAAVLIIAYDKAAGCMHYTTYGKEAIDKTSVANLSEHISRWLGDGAEPLKRFEDFRFLEVAKVKEELDQLKRFKEYVHARLDAAGVPADPESPHRAEGCRIGHLRRGAIMPGEVSRSYDPEGIYPEIGDAPLCRGCDASLIMQDVIIRGGMCRLCWEEINDDPLHTEQPRGGE